MNKKISAVIIAFIAVYGSITSAQPATDNCYFSIDYETIFDGPCNETIAEIEANFETRYEQLIFSQVISSGEDFFAYVLEEEKTNSPEYSYYEPAYFKIYWNEEPGAGHAHSLVGFGKLDESNPRCIISAEAPKEIEKNYFEQKEYKENFQLCWSGLSEKDYSPKLLELIAEARNECAEAGGELTIGFGAVTQIDISGDGKIDEVLSHSALSCSDNYGMFDGGSGGTWYTWAIDGNSGDFLTRGWSVDHPDGGQPRLLLNLHGSFCDKVGSMPCDKFYIWNANESALEELSSPINVNPEEIDKAELDEIVELANNLGVYDCYDFESAYSHREMNQVYTVGEHSIYRINCFLAAYNFGTVWFQRSEQGPLEPIYFAKPTVSSSPLVGFETVNILVNASFDPETNEISNHEKWVGHGDQSEGGTWKFEDGKFLLKEYHVDAIEDQKVNPFTVYSANRKIDSITETEVDEDNCSNDVRYCTNAQLCFELSLTSYSNFEIAGNSAFNNEEMAEAKRRGLSCEKVPSSRKERDQEWVPFGCDTERCREFTKCVINEKNTRCLYGSGSAITGGVEFEKGPSFYIEWLPEYFNNKGELVENDEDLYFALLDQKKTRFSVDEDCVIFMDENDKTIFGYGKNCKPYEAPAEDPLTKIVLRHWVEWCKEFDVEMNDGVELEAYSFEANLDENIYQIQLTPEGKMGTVLIADFSCTDGRSLCGSGGCHQYIMADGKIFQRHGHRPYSIPNQNQNFIILPSSGGNCAWSNGEGLAGAGTCNQIAVWDDDYSSFISMDNQLPLSELSPE